MPKAHPPGLREDVLMWMRQNQAGYAVAAKHFKLSYNTVKSWGDRAAAASAKAQAASTGGPAIVSRTEMETVKLAISKRLDALLDDKRIENEPSETLLRVVTNLRTSFKLAGAGEVESDEETVSEQLASVLKLAKP